MAALLMTAQNDPNFKKVKLYKVSKLLNQLTIAFNNVDDISFFFLKFLLACCQYEWWRMCLKVCHKILTLMIIFVLRVYSSAILRNTPLYI